MSKSRGVYVHIKEYPITARIGTREEFLELRDKALELNHEYVVNYSGSSYWHLQPGIKWTEVVPGSTLAHLLERLESEYPQTGSIRVMLTSTDAAFFIAGAIPGYRYVCSEKELLNLCESVDAGTIELDALGTGVGSIDMRRLVDQAPEHAVSKELTNCYAMAELTEKSARSNNHILFFEFI